MSISDEHFTKGQELFISGAGLRTVAAQFDALDDAGKTEEAQSLAFGYLDGVVSAIRTIFHTARFPAGPDK